MKRSLLLMILLVAACSADRHSPEPPPDPTEPFEDPVGTVVGSGGVGTTGPIMQTEPAMVAKSTENSTSSGGVPGTSTTTFAPEQSASADAEQIPHGPVGVGGMLPTTTTTMGNSGVGGRPPRDMTSAGNIR